MFKLKDLLKPMFAFLIVLVLGACTSPSTPESNASEVLEGEIFQKHTGDGPDELAFVDGGLLVQDAGTLTPVIEDPAEHEEATSTLYEAVDLVDGENEEFIVEYEGEELFRFHINEDELLEAEDGTVYISDGLSEESENNQAEE